jgi:hypothetical protein
LRSATYAANALEDKDVVDGDDGDLLDALGLESVELRDVARDLRVAGAREGAGYADLRCVGVNSTLSEN